jgi:hypothetical protein
MAEEEKGEQIDKSSKKIDPNYELQLDGDIFMEASNIISPADKKL